VELLIRSRRSNRAFSKEKVSEELLQRIIEAAHRAPTATNAQEVKMVLVTRPETLKEVSRITMLNGVGRANGHAVSATDAVVGIHFNTFIFLKGKQSGWAYSDAFLTAYACILIDMYLSHDME
jgi:nitroreductase